MFGKKSTILGFVALVISGFLGLFAIAVGVRMKNEANRNRREAKLELAELKGIYGCEEFTRTNDDLRWLCRRLMKWIDKYSQNA